MGGLDVVLGTVWSWSSSGWFGLGLVCWGPMFWSWGGFGMFGMLAAVGVVAVVVMTVVVVASVVVAICRCCLLSRSDSRHCRLHYGCGCGCEGRVWKAWMGGWFGIGVTV